jgi:prepilin-type N-terminal cleavage/methylation domain-containing protein
MDWWCPVTEARRRGFTLVETLIALSIGTLAMAVLASQVIFASKVARANLFQLNAGQRSRVIYEHIAGEVRRAHGIAVSPDGLTLTVTRVDGSTCSYSYQDEDGVPATIQDNRLIYDPDTTTDGDEQILSPGLNPGAGGRIFRHTDSTTPLTLTFRIGDPDADPSNPSNVMTGPGAQGIDVITAVAPRNTRL